MLMFWFFYHLLTGSKSSFTVFEPGCSKTCKLTCVPGKVFDQPSEADKEGIGDN